MEEEARLEQVQQEQEVDEKEQEQKHQQEADQTAAANEFLSLCGEVSELRLVSEYLHVWRWVRSSLVLLFL